ncbi:hypothetical protein B0G73_117130 [Paraburkholderia sp. BL25I1N1]|nr:hypothetical protein B0G73_117130 [Paraburkholderia sp. BL25I1N1]
MPVTALRRSRQPGRHGPGAHLAHKASALFRSSGEAPLHCEGARR